jgi:beta-N-acetylhexosaminidase
MRHYRAVFICSLLLLASFSGCVEKAAYAAPFLEKMEKMGGNTGAAAKERAARIAAALDNRLLAAQVIISGVDGRERLGRDMRTLLEECPAGGIMLFRYNLDANNEAIRTFVAEAVSLIATGALVNAQRTGGTYPSIPPFVAVDHEGGAVNRFKPGVADLPPARSYWEAAQNGGRDAAIAQIEADSFRAGIAINRLGVTVNFAPVAELLTDNNRAFLDDRSYGPDPDFCAGAAGAFIRGMERAGVLCAVKHFPGSAGPDPHRRPSTLGGGKAELDELAAPFAVLVSGGQARMVMVSHSTVPALDSANIASLSAAVMGGWLRDELGFEGIIICDDFSMAAAAGRGAADGGPPRPEEAVVRALAAGADMALVWPPDLRRVHRAILAALDDGRLERERLREAAARIIFEKIRMGLIDDEYRQRGTAANRRPHT